MSLKKLKELSKAATPGPWVADALDVGTPFNIDANDGKCSIAITHDIVEDGERVQRGANTELIAALRNAWPAIQAELEAGRKLAELASRSFHHHKCMYGVIGHKCDCFVKKIDKAIEAHAKAVKMTEGE